MTTPAILLNTSRYWARRPLSAVAVAPRATKTVPKPTTKADAETNTRRVTALSTGPSAVNCSRDVPPRKQRYAGTRGSTHGEAKLKNPAPRAAA